jgi:hypothetical protein
MSGRNEAENTRILRAILESDALSDTEKETYTTAILASTLLPPDPVESESESAAVDWEELLKNINAPAFAELSAKYKVTLKEGKWNYQGYIKFFGSPDSGVTPVAFWGDDGDGGLRQALRVHAPKWQDFQNDYCRITRYHYHTGLHQWENRGVIFGGFLKDGRGGNSDYSVNVQKV